MNIMKKILQRKILIETLKIYIKNMTRKLHKCVLLARWLYHKYRFHHVDLEIFVFIKIKYYAGYTDS